MEAPLVVIVGPTASGKSALAIELAEQFGGEIICADSRTVYKGMDIGTAKPSLEDQARVPHWGLDLVDPNEPFSVADFQTYAFEKIADVRSRGKIPFLVGGSGLYIDAVIFEFKFMEIDTALRAKLDKMSLEELHDYCIENNINLP
jgi:tRNA dimethylallyltransferase